MIEETLEKILAELVKMNSYYLAHSLVEVEGGKSVEGNTREGDRFVKETQAVDELRAVENQTSIDSKPGPIMFEGKQYSDFKPCKRPDGKFCDGLVSWEHRKPVEGDSKSFLPVHFDKDKIPTGRGCPTF